MWRRIFWEAVPVLRSYACFQSQMFLSWSLCDSLKGIFVKCCKCYNVYCSLFGKWKTWSLCGDFHKSITAVIMFLLRCLLNVTRWSSWFSSCKFFFSFLCKMTVCLVLELHIELHHPMTNNKKKLFTIIITAGLSWQKHFWCHLGMAKNLSLLLCWITLCEVLRLTCLGKCRRVRDTEEGRTHRQ